MPEITAELKIDPGKLWWFLWNRHTPIDDHFFLDQDNVFSRSVQVLRTVIERFLRNGLSSLSFEALQEYYLFLMGTWRSVSAECVIEYGYCQSDFACYFLPDRHFFSKSDLIKLFSQLASLDIAASLSADQQIIINTSPSIEDVYTRLFEQLESALAHSSNEERIKGILTFCHLGVMTRFFGDQYSHILFGRILPFALFVTHQFYPPLWIHSLDMMGRSSSSELFERYDEYAAAYGKAILHGNEEPVIKAFDGRDKKYAEAGLYFLTEDERQFLVELVRTAWASPAFDSELPPCVRSRLVLPFSGSVTAEKGVSPPSRSASP